MRQLREWVAGLVLLLWATTAAYLTAASFMHGKALEDVVATPTAAGSYDYQGLNFRDRQELEAFIRQERLGSLFPWTVDLPTELSPLLLAISAACLGGVTAVVRPAILSGRRLAALPYLGQPILGLAIGFMLFLVATIVPAIMTSGPAPYRPESVLALSFFGGLFSDRTFAWIEEQVSQLFRKSAKGQEE